MLETALELIGVIEDNGFKAYLVGGCVRNLILGENYSDIDICTSATPYEIRNIFTNNLIKSEKYGSLTLIYKDIKFEITTFRKEESYTDGRRPDSYTYIDSLEEDLKRRDFTINTICMDRNKNIIDIYNGIDDIKLKIIKTVGDPDNKFYEDPLRMLRAIRFATVLDFNIIPKVKQAIINNASRIELISYERRRIELDKIFLSKNREYGVKLLLETGLYKYLGLDNLENVELIDDIIGIWAQIRNFKYPFKKSERKIINLIIQILDNNIDVENNFSLYKYGLYICMIVSNIRKKDLNKISDIYNNIPIISFDSLEINTEEICDLLKIKPGIKLKEIYDDIIYSILSCNIKNNKEDIMMYLKNKYNMIK